MPHHLREQSKLPAPDPSGLCTLTTDITGTLVAETRYLLYGEERWITGTLVTDFTFTGQRAERGFGLMDYNARYYDPWLGRFISADTVVPEPGNPQGWNRYSYAIGNSLGYTDPTGHCADPASALVCIVLVQLVVDAAAVGLGLHLIHNANQDIAELNPPPYHLDNSSEIEAETFPLGSPPDPYSPLAWNWTCRSGRACQAFPWISRIQERAPLTSRQSSQGMSYQTSYLRHRVSMSSLIYSTPGKHTLDSQVMLTDDSSNMNALDGMPPAPLLLPQSQAASLTEKSLSRIE